MDNDLARLKALALAATPGPWTRSERPCGPFWHISSDHSIGGKKCPSGRQAIGSMLAENKRSDPEYAVMFESNANFVAVANPSSVLDLIAQIERLTAERAAQFPLNEQTEFDKYMSNDGEWNRAIERDSEGNYLLIEAATAWAVWQARAALPPPTAQTVPPGWSLVPIEPTEDMVVMGFSSVPDRIFDGDKYPEEYDAMSGCQQAAFRAKRCDTDVIGLGVLLAPVHRDVLSSSQIKTRAYLDLARVVVEHAAQAD